MKTKNPVNYERLGDPVADDMANAYFAELGVEDEGLRALYAWKNGFDLLAGKHPRCMLFDYDAPIPLEHIKRFVKARTPVCWAAHFIPILTDGTGQFLLFNNLSGNSYGRIHLYSASLLFVEEPVSYFDSVASMLQTTLEGYRQDVMVYDPTDDWLDIDTDRWWALGKQFNMGSEYWRL